MVLVKTVSLANINLDDKSAYLTFEEHIKLQDALLVSSKFDCLKWSLIVLIAKFRNAEKEAA